jgi:hypothetical protein
VGSADVICAWEAQVKLVSPALAAYWRSCINSKVRSCVDTDHRLQASFLFNFSDKVEFRNLLSKPVFYVLFSYMHKHNERVKIRFHYGRLTFKTGGKSQKSVVK